MHMHILLVTHDLPLWFLVFALFLPRVALLVAWLQGNLMPFHLYGWIPPVLAVLLPRVLILILIYRDQGFDIWFLIHLVALLCVWGGTSGKKMYRRRED